MLTLVDIEWVIDQSARIVARLPPAFLVTSRFEPIQERFTAMKVDCDALVKLWEKSRLSDRHSKKRWRPYVREGGVVELAKVRRPE